MEEDAIRSHSDVVYKAADKLSEIISRQDTNNTALRAVIEVKLETAVVISPSWAMSGW